MIEKIRKNNKLLIPIIVLVLIIILGVTYAWMTFVVSGTKVNRITVGALSLVLDDEASNGINIENGLPQTDSQGLNNTEYTFSVINNGASNAKYRVILEDEELEDGEQRMSDSNVKIYLVRNNEESEAKLLSSVVKEEKRVLDEDIIIEPRETNNYSLRLWIDGDSSQEEVGGKVFKARIKLEAVQTEESNETYNLNGYVYDSNDNILTNGVVVAYSEPKYSDIDNEGHFNILGLESGTHTLYYVPNKTIEEVKTLNQNEIEQISGVGKVSINTRNNDSIISFNNGNVIKRYTIKKLEVNDQFVYGYTGKGSVFKAEEGIYKIELWGASAPDGNGAYTSGNINIDKSTDLYLYIGSTGIYDIAGGWNGGGNSRSTNGGYVGSGGGATDIRYFGENYTPTSLNLNWNSAIGLNSRIMVAGAAGAGSSGGGISGYDGKDSSYQRYQGKAGTQISGGAVPSAYGCGALLSPTAGSFGYGGYGALGNSTTSAATGAGGAGYYGGSGADGACNASWHGGSGSSYISGHTGCVAIAEGSTSEPRAVKISGCTTGTTNNECSIHYSGLKFTNTKMIDGTGYSWTNVKGTQEVMPNPNGGNYALGVGHSGNGYARITYLGK